MKDAIIQETTRCYIFPNDEEYNVDGVIHISVSKSGGHRLTTKDGLMYYIPFTWLAIEIRSDHGWEA